MLSLSTRPCSSVSVAVRERNVETSTVSSPNITCTSLKRLPIRRERRKILCTSSGYASVATSKSLGRRPSNRSRTAPPTTYASWPWLCCTSQTLREPCEIASRPIPCCSFGTVLGPEPEDAPNEFLDQEGRKLRGPAASRGHWYSASRLAWVSISFERPRLARPASYSKTAKPQCRAA